MKYRIILSQQGGDNFTRRSRLEAKENLDLTGSERIIGRISMHIEPNVARRVSLVQDGRLFESIITQAPYGVPIPWDEK